MVGGSIGTDSAGNLLFWGTTGYSLSTSFSSSAWVSLFSADQLAIYPATNDGFGGPGSRILLRLFWQFQNEAVPVNNPPLATDGHPDSFASNDGTGNNITMLTNTWIVGPSPLDPRKGSLITVPVLGNLVRLSVAQQSVTSPGRVGFTLLPITTNPAVVK